MYSSREAKLIKTLSKTLEDKDVEATGMYSSREAKLIKTLSKTLEDKDVEATGMYSSREAKLIKTLSKTLEDKDVEATAHRYENNCNARCIKTLSKSLYAIGSEYGGLYKYNINREARVIQIICKALKDQDIEAFTALKTATRPGFLRLSFRPRKIKKVEALSFVHSS
jgi:hypothetical protein